MRLKMEGEREALAAFVRKFDSIGLSSTTPTIPPTKLHPPLPTPGGAAAVFAERQRNRLNVLDGKMMSPLLEVDSPVRVNVPVPLAAEPSLLEERWDAMDDMSLEMDGGRGRSPILRGLELFSEVGIDKENMVPLP